MTQSDERSMAAAARAAADAAAMMAKTAWVADVDITYSGLLALNLAPRTKTFSIQAAKAGDRVCQYRSNTPQ